MTILCFPLPLFFIFQQRKNDPTRRGPATTITTTTTTTATATTAHKNSPTRAKRTT